MSSRPRILVTVPFLLLLAIPFLVFGVLSVRLFEVRILPEVELQTTTAATGVQRRVAHAISVFGGLHTLRDVEPVLDNARSSAPGMSFLALTGPDGEILHLSADDPEAVRAAFASDADMDRTMSETFRSGGGLPELWQEYTGLPLAAPVTTSSRLGGRLLVTEMPLGDEGENPVGFLQAGVDIGMLDTLKRDIWFDTAVVVFAIVLLAVELLILIAAAFILRPAWIIDFLTARLAAGDLRFTLRLGRGGALRDLIRRVDRITGQIAASAGSRVKVPSGLRLPGREGRFPLRVPAVSHIRFPLFLFFLSEAMLRPILPQFLGDFSPPESETELRTGLVMAGFMAASLVSVLVGSILAQGSGARRVFLLGAVASGIGMAGHIVADGFATILLMRMLTGFGYGLVYAAAQVYIAQHADPGRRSSGFSLFLAVVVAAEICGPAMGGILADRLGVELVLFTAAAVIGMSALACLTILSKSAPDLTDPTATPEPQALDPSTHEMSDRTGPVEGRGKAWDWRRVLAWFPGKTAMFAPIAGNIRFSVVIACFAIPAKALLTGGLFFLVPLIAFANGGATASARILIGYGIAILVLAPLLSPLADRWRGFGIWVSAGGMIAGAGFVLPHAWDVLGDSSLVVLFVATLLFGVGQALSIPAQISFLLQVSERQVAETGAGPVLGVFRFLERLGSMVGPLIAGGLLVIFPPDVALMWMGLGAMLLAACGWSWFMATGDRDEEEAIRGLLVEA